MLHWLNQCGYRYLYNEHIVNDNERILYATQTPGL